MITAIVVAIAFMTVSNVSAAEERQVRFPISIADVEPAQMPSLPGPTAIWTAYYQARNLHN